MSRLQQVIVRGRKVVEIKSKHGFPRVNLSFLRLARPTTTAQTRDASLETPKARVAGLTIDVEKI
jgi:hypothetical protein